MTNYIFDLDYTLYDSQDVDVTNTKIFYNSFKDKKFLNKLLKNLKGNKYIFSNGNKAHVDYVVKKMNFKDIFIDIANSDEFEMLKPNTEAYDYVIDKFNIKNDEVTYFFEDTLENLETAKEFGWKTILIDEENKLKKNPKFVDFKFKSVEQALLFFNNVNQ